MKLKRAERLTGYEVRRVKAPSGKVAFGAFRDDQLMADATHKIDELALDLLVRKVYQIHSAEALHQHGWRCARCHGSKRLQIHHRRYRSHGGTHQVDNLEPLCWDCHKVVHRLERSK